LLNTKQRTREYVGHSNSIKVRNTFEIELRILASVMLANVSRPSKIRSAFAAVRSPSVTVNVFLNAQSASPTPVSHGVGKS